MEHAQLLAIATKAYRKAPMEEFQSAEISLEMGVNEDFRGKVADRQVTVVSREAWQAASDELGAQVPWTARRANLLIEGVELAHTAGQVLTVGPVQLEITGETEPCGRMDEYRQGLQAALRSGRWRAGVTCRVLRGGGIKVGDPVSLSPAEVPVR